jgi:hypothetical protein
MLKMPKVPKMPKVIVSLRSIDFFYFKKDRMPQF